MAWLMGIVMTLEYCSLFYDGKKLRSVNNLSFSQDFTKNLADCSCSDHSKSSLEVVHKVSVGSHRRHAVIVSARISNLYAP